jgi:hypothetical protein|tara:strand:- start:49 stop:300 length:252 start_codon:yes stop_codon:yes gene_type:complete
MNGEIRKISVGKDYPDGVLHYQVGKIINLVGNPYKITDILLDRTFLEVGKVVYNIYIADHKGKVMWKTVYEVPTVIEYNINFE